MHLTIQRLPQLKKPPRVCLHALTQAQKHVCTCYRTGTNVDPLKHTPVRILTTSAHVEEAQSMAGASAIAATLGARSAAPPPARLGSLEDGQARPQMHKCAGRMHHGVPSLNLIACRRSQTGHDRMCTHHHECRYTCTNACARACAHTHTHTRTHAHTRTHTHKCSRMQSHTTRRRARMNARGCTDALTHRHRHRRPTVTD